MNYTKFLTEISYLDIIMWIQKKVFRLQVPIKYQMLKLMRQFWTHEGQF